MFHGGIVTPREIYPKSKSAAMKAIELDPSLPEAHAALAYIALHYDWDWLNAEREYKRAIDLNPKYPTAHSSYARFLTAMGRFDEALAELKLAQKLDPVGLGIATGVGLTLYMARRYDEAIAQYSKVIELEPNYALARFNLGGALAQKSRLPDAIASFEAGFRIAKSEAGSLGELGNAYARSGKRQEALGTLDKLEGLRAKRYVSPYFSALVHAGLGDTDKCLESLGRAFEDRSSSMVFLDVEPRFDPVRREPRFQELLKLVGLAD
jgi:tetratricopeptide (TPR) repeat protein